MMRGGICSLLIAACGLLVAWHVVAENGDWSEMIKAQQLFQEVYGERLKTARTPEQKARLAREILDVAKKETELAAKRVELEEAKTLAIAADDGGLAVEIVRELAKLPRDNVPENPLAEAERLWNDAKTLSDKVDAVELYFRSNSQSPLINAQWRLRIEKLTEGNAIVLRAKDARIVGIRFNYSEQDDCLRDWYNASEFAEWQIYLPKGYYKIVCEYACLGDGAKSLFAIEAWKPGARFPASAISFSLVPTGGWVNFARAETGTVRVLAGGDYTIRFRAIKKVKDSPSLAFINVRSIILLHYDRQ